jgi:hypothetical protein
MARKGVGPKYPIRGNEPSNWDRSNYSSSCASSRGSSLGAAGVKAYPGKSAPAHLWPQLVAPGRGRIRRAYEASKAASSPDRGRDSQEGRALRAAPVRARSRAQRPACGRLRGLRPRARPPAAGPPARQRQRRDQLRLRHDAVTRKRPVFFGVGLKKLVRRYLWPYADGRRGVAEAGQLR